MSTTQVVEGTLKPDGTLELSQTIHLPPGQVRVTVEAPGEPSQPAEDWWSYLRRARAELEAAGVSFSTGEEINRYIEEIRNDTDPTDVVSSEHEPAGSHQGRKPC